MLNAERSLNNGRMIQHAINRRRLLKMERLMASTPESGRARAAADPPPAPKQPPKVSVRNLNFYYGANQRARGQLD